MTRGNLETLYVVSGADYYLYQKFVLGLKQGFQQRHGTAGEIIQRWGTDLKVPADLTNLLGGGGLFSSASLILLHEVQGAAVGVKTQLSKILAKIPAETTVLVQYNLGDNRRAKWVNSLRSLGKEISLQAPEADQLPQVVRQMAEEYQLVMDESAVLRLIELGSGELSVIHNELEKFTLYLDDPATRINAELVDHVTGILENAQVDHFIAAVSRRDRELAIRTLTEIYHQGKAGLPYLVALLYNRLAQLMALQEPVEARKTIGQGMTSYYFLKDMGAFAHNYKMTELQQAVDLLADLDLRFRLGSMDMLAAFSAWLSRVV